MSENNNKVYKVNGHYGRESYYYTDDSKGYVTFDSENILYDNIHYESHCEDVDSPKDIFSSKQAASVRFEDYKKLYFQMMHYGFLDHKKLLSDENIPDLLITNEGHSIDIDLPTDCEEREYGFEKIICSGNTDNNGDVFFKMELEGNDYSVDLAVLYMKEISRESCKEDEIIELEFAESEYAKPQSFVLGNNKDGDVVEPIEWIFVKRENDKALVVSKYGLFNKHYDNKRTADGNHPWNNSTLRNWLNNEFYNESFTPEEKEQILFCENEEENIHEKIFLLSGHELMSDFSRLWICEPSKILSRHVKPLFWNRLGWFLRDVPGYHKYGHHYSENQIAGIFSYDCFGDVVYEETIEAVRPAMWVKMPK